MKHLSLILSHANLDPYQLSFSQTGSTFIGNADFFAFSNVGASAFQISAPGIPAVAFALYQLMFATITPPLFSDQSVRGSRLCHQLSSSSFGQLLFITPLRTGPGQTLAGLET